MPGYGGGASVMYTVLAGGCKTCVLFMNMIKNVFQNFTEFKIILKKMLS